MEDTEGDTHAGEGERRCGEIADSQSEEWCGNHHEDVPPAKEPLREQRSSRECQGQDSEHQQAVCKIDSQGQGSEERRVWCKVQQHPC